MAVLYQRKRAFGSPIATVYKTEEILTMCTFSKTIGRRPAARKWRSRAHLRNEKCKNTNKGQKVIMKERKKAQSRKTERRNMKERNKEKK